MFGRYLNNKSFKKTKDLLFNVIGDRSFVTLSYRFGRKEEINNKRAD